jgi:hypothetical protein
MITTKAQRTPTHHERETALMHVLDANRHRGPRPGGERPSFQSPEAELRQLAERALAMEWVRALIGPELVVEASASASGRGITITVEPQQPSRRSVGHRWRDFTWRGGVSGS